MMDWIHTNLNGKVSMVFGAMALIFIVAITSVEELNDGQPGLVSYLVSNMSSALTPSGEKPTEPTMVSVGILPLSEKHEKKLLMYLSIALAVFSLLFSLIAERTKEYNLYYAAGVLCSFTALVFSNIVLAMALVIPTLYILWLLRRAPN